MQEEFSKRFLLRTVMRVEHVNVYLEDGCSQADVEGVCASDHLCGTLVPCTLYFPLDSPEQISRFNRLRCNYQVGSYHFIDASELSLFDPDVVNFLFTGFTTEPATVEQSSWLDAQFAAAEVYDVKGGKL